MAEILYIAPAMEGGVSPPDIPCTSVDDFDGDGGPSGHELNKFWELMNPWLLSYGLVLYDLRPAERSQGGAINMAKTWYPPLTGTAAPLPYAVMDRTEISLSREFDIYSRLACAQDTAGRNVVLKLVDKNNYQHRIYESLLQDLSLFSDPQSFPCVLPPLAVLETPHNYSVVSMPMWGNPIHLEDFQTPREVLRFMDCVLRGLVYLHSKRIAHRDICEENMVVNYHRLDHNQQLLPGDLRKYRTSECVFYALMDYDQSIILPQHESLRQCRRPAEEAWMGNACYKPRDILLGQQWYNPFALDVGMLGNVFRVHFSEAVSVIPALAPLFDKMTTHDVTQRYTADEAWQFFKDEISRPSKEVLVAPQKLHVNFQTMTDSGIYWSKLSPQMQTFWGRFRTPEPSLWMKALRWFIWRVPHGWDLVVAVRRVLQL